MSMVETRSTSTAGLAFTWPLTWPVVCRRGQEVQHLGVLQPFYPLDIQGRRQWTAGATEGGDCDPRAAGTAQNLGALGGQRGGHRWVTRPSPQYCTLGVPGPMLTRQPVDKPAQLFLGDIGPAEVQETGCRRMMPLSIRGVMDLQWFKSMRVRSTAYRSTWGPGPAEGATSELGSSLGSLLHGC